MRASRRRGVGGEPRADGGHDPVEDRVQPSAASSCDRRPGGRAGPRRAARQHLARPLEALAEVARLAGHQSAAAALSATASEAADRSSPPRIASSRRALSSTSPPRSDSGSPAPEPSSAGSTCQVPTTAAVPDLDHRGRRRHRQLVEAVVGVDHQRVLGAELGERGGDQLLDVAAPDPDHLTADAGRVGEGPSRLNTVRTPEARRTGITAAIAGCSRGANRKAMPTSSCSRQRPTLEVEPHAGRLEHVGRAAARRHRAVAVLGHRHPGRRRHQRRGGGDVDRVGAVAAGAAGVDRAVRRRHGDGAGAHGPSRGRDLGAGLALGAQRDQHCRDLGVLELPVHDRADEGLQLVGVEVVAVDQPLEDSFDSRAILPPRVARGGARHATSRRTQAWMPGTQPRCHRRLPTRSITSSSSSHLQS